MWVWHVPSVPVALASLTGRLQTVFGAGRAGRWWTTCDHLTQKRPTGTATITSVSAGSATVTVTNQPPTANRELYCLSFSSQADRSHCISPGVTVTSSAAFPAFLASSAGYTSRSTYVAEGECFTLGDFTLSIGTLRHNGRYTSSVVLQLAYQPCCQPLPATFQLLQGVLEGLIAGESGGKEAAVSYRPAGGWPLFGDFGLGDVWTARHTALMWLFALQLSRPAT